MLTLRPSVRSSTSVPLTTRASSPPSPSSVPTAPSSTRTTSSATGGSTSTAPKPRASTPSTTRSLPRGKNLPGLPPTHYPPTQPAPFSLQPRFRASSLSTMRRGRAGPGSPGRGTTPLGSSRAVFKRIVPAAK